jgi:hypothetical protein
VALDLRGAANAINYIRSVGERELPEGYLSRSTVGEYSNRWGAIGENNIADPNGVWAAVMNVASQAPEQNAGLDEPRPTNAGSQVGPAADNTTLRQAMQQALANQEERNARHARHARSRESSNER